MTVMQAGAVNLLRSCLEKRLFIVKGFRQLSTSAAIGSGREKDAQSNQTMNLSHIGHVRLREPERSTFHTCILPIVFGPSQMQLRCFCNRPDEAARLCVLVQFCKKTFLLGNHCFTSDSIIHSLDSVDAFVPSSDTRKRAELKLRRLPSFYFGREEFGVVNTAKRKR